MDRVLEELDQASFELASKPVHNLRVAIRRCRSIAEGIQALDPHSSWKKMRRKAKELFSSLGALRDCQVLTEWTSRIGETDDPATAALLQYFSHQEQALKEEVQRVFQKFDRKRWQHWATALPRRAAHLRPGSDAFQCLALERWLQARRLEPGAIRTWKPASLHRLRIAVKKLRYVVENFLPHLYPDWEKSFKEIQDILGEIHDLDLLLETAIRIGALESLEAGQRWQQRVHAERQNRIEHYRSRMLGESSFWNVWRSGLPRGEHARRAALTKLETWAAFLGSDRQHLQRVGRFALQLYNQLPQSSVSVIQSRRFRELLRAAAILYAMGQGEHKRARRLISKMDVPGNRKKQDFEMAALIAGYKSNTLKPIHLPLRNLAKRLAGIVRLAHAFDFNRDGAIRRISVASHKDYIVIHAEGLKSTSTLAEKIAAARYLLEVSCGVPIMVKPLRAAK